MKHFMCLFAFALLVSNLNAEEPKKPSPADQQFDALMKEMKATNKGLEGMEKRLNDKIDTVRKDVVELDRKVDDRMNKLENRVAKLEDRPATTVAATVVAPVVTAPLHIVHTHCVYRVLQWIPPCGCGCSGHYEWVTTSGPTWGYGYGGYSSGWYGYFR